METNDQRDEIQAILLSIVSDLLNKVGRQNIILPYQSEDTLLQQKIRVTAMLEDYLMVMKPSVLFTVELAKQYLKYLSQKMSNKLLLLEHQLILSLTNTENLNIQIVGCQKLTSEEISLLQIILNSDYFRNYLMIRMNILNDGKYDQTAIQNEIDQCLRYFDKQTIGVIEEIDDQEVIGIVYPNKRIMISQSIWNVKSINLLFLLHLYYQIDIQGKSNIILCVKKQFLSKIWGSSFDQSEEFIKFVSNSNNWNLDQYSFAKQQLALYNTPQDYTSIVEYIEYNQIIKRIIGKIVEMLEDIINLDVQQLQQKYIFDGYNYPKLHRYYSDLQYWFYLFIKIRNCTYNSKRIERIKEANINSNRQNYLQKIFQIIMKTNEYERFLILQQLFLWIFKKDFENSVSLISDVCLDILHCKITSKMLSIEDRNLIRNIIKSKQVRQAFNQLDNRQCSMANVNQEYNELMDFLDKTPIIRYSAKETDGLYLISGRIALNRDTCYNKLNPLRSRALRIVTLLRETFLHKKRTDYVTPFDILKITPDELNYETEKADFYFLYRIIGREVVIENNEQASYILNEQNWLKPVDQFNEEYLSLGPQLTSKLIDSNYNRSQLQSLSYRQDRREHQTTRCLRKTKKKKYQ